MWIQCYRSVCWIVSRFEIGFEVNTINQLTMFSLGSDRGHRYNGNCDICQLLAAFADFGIGICVLYISTVLY